jgi:2-polyprenyl-6-methoxyphenol hydroxylase-like FAD-dependent oxidoreductase
VARGSRNELPILIVGGGLGGLAAALALGQRGFHVKVLEQEAEFGTIGYGIQLAPNVFHMLDHLGLTEQVLAHAHVPSAVLMLDALDGVEIERIPTTTPAFLQRFKYPYVVIHRIDLHHVLIDACRAIPSIEMIASTTATGVEDRGDRVRLTVAGGETIDGIALIGADGLRSCIRAGLVDEGEPNPIGFVAHRTVRPMAEVPKEVQRDEVILWAGPGFHIVHYPLRRGELFNIVAVFRTSTYLERNDVGGYRREIEESYRTAYPAMKTLLGLMDLERRWTLSDRDPVRHWSKGRVTILGDAAHPTLQSLAQGACMAIEDGVYLAALIDLADGDIAGAFYKYQADRLVRTARVQLESRYLWEVYHAAGVHRDVMRATFFERSDEDVFRCLAWLYDGVPLPAKQPNRQAAAE